MKFSKLGLLAVSVFISISAFSQAIKPENNTVEDIWEKRMARVKAGILQDIETLSSKEQAKYYGRFGKIFLSKDKKEAALWITQALEIAFNPATEYKDNKEKIEVVRSILVFYEVLENEEGLFKKPIAEIVKVLNQEVNEKRSDEYGGLLITLANQLLKKEEKLATDLAVLSLKGNKPVFDWNSYLFLQESKNKNAALSERYFTKALDLAKTSGNIDHLLGLLRISFEYSNTFSSKVKPLNVSETQKKELLELLVPYIQKESDELLQKKRDNCILTKAYGKRFLDDYKKLLTPSAGFVEQALIVCQTAAIEFWRKPDFEAKTSQDYLDLAKRMTDKPSRISQTMNAASRAGHDERNYRLAIEILDGIDEESRKITPSLTHWWESERLQSGSEFTRALLGQGKFTEVRQFIENSPPNLRPFIVIRAMNFSITYGSKYKQFFLELLDQAKTELFSMEIPELQNNNFLSLMGLGSVNNLVKYYYDLGFQNESIGLYEEYLIFFSRIHNRMLSEKGEVSPYTFYNPQMLPKNFIETYFEQIYQNIEKLENLRFRLNSRINLFQDIKYNIQIVPNQKSSVVPTIKPNK